MSDLEEYFNNIMPEVKGSKYWSLFSSLFSVLSLLVTILTLEFLTNYLNLLSFLDSSFIWIITLVLSISSYACLIVSIDVPRRVAKQLEKEGELKEFEIKKLKRSRIWVLLAYTSPYLMATLLVEIFTLEFNLYLFLIIGVVIGVILLSLPKFTHLIQGSKNLELVASVDASYMSGFIFSIVLGLGGSFYLSIWILIVNLMAKLRGQKSKEDKMEYWDKIVSIEMKDNNSKILSALVFLDLIIFFIFFKDFQALISAFMDQPLSSISVLIFISFPLFTFGYKSINFSNINIINAKQAYVLLIIIKFLLLIPVVIFLDYSSSVLRFSDYISVGSLNAGDLLIALGIFSPMVFIVLPISRLAENAKLEKNLDKFNNYFILMLLSTITIFLILIILFMQALVDFQFNLFFIAMGIIIPLLVFYDVGVYNTVMNDLKPDLKKADKINISKVVLLSFFAVIFSVIGLFNLEYIAFLTPTLKYAIFSVPMIINQLIIVCASYFILKLGWEKILVSITSGLLSTASWAMILFLGAIELKPFLVSFVIAYVFTCLTSIIIYVIENKIKN